MNPIIAPDFFHNFPSTNDAGTWGQWQSLAISMAGLQVMAEGACGEDLKFLKMLTYYGGDNSNDQQSFVAVLQGPNCSAWFPAWLRL
jgi:hypothetical protein